MIEAMKLKLSDKDRQLEGLRKDNTRLRKENFDLKNAVTKLKEAGKSSNGSGSGEARGPRAARVGGEHGEVDSETLMQLQMAMQMS